MRGPHKSRKTLPNARGKLNAMTEDEAKTKWCPFARVAEPWRYVSTSTGPMPVAAPAVNRGSDAQLFSASHCIASACMAWRWHRASEHVDGYGENQRGFCGLAGEVLAPRIERR
jgi:hypothetical protein